MLDMHPYIMIVTLIIFFVMLYVLNVILFKPLLGFMDARDSAIQRDMEAVNNFSGSKDKLLQEAEQNINEAKARAGQIRQEAMEAAKTRLESAVSAKKVELENLHDKFTLTLVEKKSELESGLLSQLPLIKEGMKAKFSQI